MSWSNQSDMSRVVRQKWSKILSVFGSQAKESILKNFWLVNRVRISLHTTMHCRNQLHSIKRIVILLFYFLTTMQLMMRVMLKINIHLSRHNLSDMKSTMNWKHRLENKSLAISVTMKEFQYNFRIQFNK